MGKVNINRDVTFVENQPGATTKEAATEADKARPTTIEVEAAPPPIEEEEEDIEVSPT